MAEGEWRMEMALLAGIGCCALGFAVSGAAGMRLRALRACARAVRGIRTGVCVRSEALDRVLCGLPAGGDREERAWASFFRRLGEALAWRPGATLAESWHPAWREACNEHPALRALTQKDLRLISPLREELGCGTRGEQQDMFERVLADLHERQGQLQGKLADTQRIAQTLGMMGGLALFLLLM